MTERKRRLRTGATLAILAVLALVALWCDINAGYRSISLEELGQILSGTASQSLTYTLVDLRLPRVLTSLLVGVGLSLSGCLLQGVSRNDMADPGVLGINAGAGLLVAAFIVFVPAGLVPLGGGPAGARLRGLGGRGLPRLAAVGGARRLKPPAAAAHRRRSGHGALQRHVAAHAAHVRRRLRLRAELARRRHLGRQLGERGPCSPWGWRCSLPVPSTPRAR